MNTAKLWKLINSSEAYQRWAKRNNAFEQIAIVKNWCDYEDYGVTDLCHNSAIELLTLYCYLHFVLDVEFLTAAQAMAADTKCEDYFKVDVKNAQLLVKELNA